MLASSVVHVHLAAAVPCSRARRPLPPPLPTSTPTPSPTPVAPGSSEAPANRPDSDRSGCPCIGYVACDTRRRSTPFARWAIRFGRAVTSALPAVTRARHAFGSRHMQRRGRGSPRRPSWTRRNSPPGLGRRSRIHGQGALWLRVRGGAAARPTQERRSRQPTRACA
jgi:hypothetical protein